MDVAGRELIAELARDVVTTTAPDELPLFRATSEAFLNSPESVMRRVGARDETLGFGADAFVALTPFALAVASTVVTFLAQQARAVAQETAGEAVRDVLRSWLARVRPGGRAGTAAAPGLTADQLARVRAVAYEKARALELSEAQASLLADSMAGRLAASS
jgi:hypothetical protein